MSDRDELIDLLHRYSDCTVPRVADMILEAGFHKRPVGIPLSALLEKHHGGIEITRHTPDCSK